MHRETTGEPFFCAVLEGRCRVSVNGQPYMTVQAGDFVLVPAMHDLINESVDAPPGGMTTRPIEVSDGCFRAGREGRAVELRMTLLWRRPVAAMFGMRFSNTGSGVTQSGARRTRTMATTTIMHS
ncbi:MAG: DUF861 domain-containing protein [Acetobacteraceae bacterium]|nr:DUF861 domain-containing protein [Acetobacteraceae bacterium]